MSRCVTSKKRLRGRLPFRGKVLCREDSGNGKPVQCNGRHDNHRKMRENATVFGQDSARNRLFFSRCLWKWLFLFLWHFWAKLIADVAANRWNVGHVLRCVRPHRLVVLNVSALFKCIYGGKLLHLFRRLFKNQIFSCFPLRRRFLKVLCTY